MAGDAFNRPLSALVAQARAVAHQLRAVDDPAPFDAVGRPVPDLADRVDELGDRGRRAAVQALVAAAWVRLARALDREATADVTRWERLLRDLLDDLARDADRADDARAVRDALGPRRSPSFARSLRVLRLVLPVLSSRAPRLGTLAVAVHGEGDGLLGRVEARERFLARRRSAQREASGEADAARDALRAGLRATVRAWDLARGHDPTLPALRLQRVARHRRAADRVPDDAT